MALKNLSIMLKIIRKLLIIIIINVVIQCTIIIALVMFEHSQQVKHLGTSQISSEAMRKLFQQQLKMAAPARPFQLQQTNKGLN